MVLWHLYLWLTLQLPQSTERVRLGEELISKEESFLEKGEKEKSLVKVQK